MAKALIVDDEPDMRQLVRITIKLDFGDDVEVLEASGGRDALERWRADRPDLVLLDYEMFDATGVEVAEIILAEDPTQPIVIFTVSPDSAELNDRSRYGFRAVVSKHDLNDLRQTLRRNWAPRASSPPWGVSEPHEAGRRP